MSDDELKAVQHALGAVEPATVPGALLYAELVTERAKRQQLQAREEGWHVSTRPPAAPEWES